MKKLIFVFLFLMLFAGFAGAEAHKYGPYPNYKGTVEQNFSIIVPTVVDMYVVDPHGKSYNIGGQGGQEFEVTVQNKPIFAASYVEFESSETAPFNPETDSLILTEIWGTDLEPEIDPNLIPPMGGIFPPDLIPAPGGFYVGDSGTYYQAPLEFYTYDQLPAVLPGYNLEQIVPALPDMVFYVSQAVVPASDFAEEIKCDPYFLIDSAEQWQEALDSQWPHEHIRPVTPEEWNEYRAQWENQDNDINGIPYFDPYPDTEFLPAKLYVYDGGGGGAEPEDAGLVMTWGDDTIPDGNYASAWHWDYGLDPDLTNCTIQITVTAPQFGMAGQINQVSFSIVDINGNRRTWWWQVGPAGGGTPIEWWVPKTVTINTNITGTAAANPVATGFLNTAAFDLTKSQSFEVDENSLWIFGPLPVPPPNQPTFVGMWNYWHNLLVTKNTSIGANKGIYTKWSQPPVEIDGEDPAVSYINGWDEWSNHQNMPVMADDWKCNDTRPITDIHWWGSFQGWRLRKPPTIMPTAFHIGIWTDVPKHSADNLMPDPSDSHPRELIWENICTNYVWNFAGIDVDPRNRPDYVDETCFQFTQLLNEDEWFYQHPMEDGMPNVYWLSIAAIFDASQIDDPDFHEWGWKTRPHYFNDDAVRIVQATIMPLRVGSKFLSGVAIKYPDGVTWDLAFELTTNEPSYQDEPIPGDITGPVGIPDGVVNFFDIAKIATHWLSGTIP